MKKILGILVLSLLLSGNAHAKKNDIVIPKYFFANELTRETYPLEGVHGHGSWGKAYWELDLAITHVSKKKNPDMLYPICFTQASRK